MAMFYGTLQGRGGQATRLGHANSGLKVTAQSYAGSVITDIYFDKDTQSEFCRISVACGSTQYGVRNLYLGPVSRLFTANLGE